MGNDFLLYNKWMLKYTGNVCVETEYSIKDEHSEDQYTTTYRDGRIVKQQGAERNSWQYMWGYSNSKVAWKAVVEWNKNMRELIIFIPCAHSDVERVNRAPKAESGED